MIKSNFEHHSLSFILYSQLVVLHQERYALVSALNIILYHSSFFTLNLLYFTKRYALVSAMGYFFNTVWLWTYSSTKNKGNTTTPNIALFFKIFTTQKLLSSNINQVFTFKIFPNICRSDNHASKQIPPFPPTHTYTCKNRYFGRLLKLGTF